MSIPSRDTAYHQSRERAVAESLRVGKKWDDQCTTNILKAIELGHSGAYCDVVSENLIYELRNIKMMDVEPMQCETGLSFWHVSWDKKSNPK
jgi:hypothetical protein